MISLPVLLSLATALTTMILRRRIRLSKQISIVGSIAVLISTTSIFWNVYTVGPKILQWGNWPSPFGISFYCDTLSALMLVIGSLMGLCGNLASIETTNLRHQARGYDFFFHLMMMGIFGSFSTGDLFNLYVWFEVFLLSSFSLVAISNRKGSYAGAYKYTLLSLFSSLIFLGGVSAIYAGSGSLEIRHLTHLALSLQQSPEVALGGLMLLTAFAIKAALFPFYFWLPATYPKVESSAAAVFSGLLTKVGIYALLRIFSSKALTGSEDLVKVLFPLSLLSMVLGVLGALSQNDVRRILSFHIISQVGYIVLALSLDTRLGIAACVFYLTHHIVVKTNLFFCSSFLEIKYGSDKLPQLGGVAGHSHFAAILFAISALSLIGVPPLSGFWAKIFTLNALIDQGQQLAFILCLAVSFLTLASMTKIWSHVYWGPNPRLPSPKRHSRWLLLVMSLLTAWTVSVGVFSEKVHVLTLRISQEILPPQKDSL